MKKATVDVLVCLFAYGGNGGVSSIIPELGMWLARQLKKMDADPRIDRIKPIILSDTPITMTRNRAVRIAQDEGFDMILMLDSDNEPDGYLGADPAAKPFWDEAFEFAYNRLVQGTPTVIAAPYCGPPPHPVHESGGEVPYLFEWMDNESDTDNPQRKLELLTRNEAARLRGIFPVAALPTGVCLFTTNIFEGVPKPYFAYEWNEDHSEKRSTEDVYCTRNLSLYWAVKHNLIVCYAACDSWALHYKPKKVGRPRPTPVEVYAKGMRDALIDNPISAREKKVDVDYTKDLPRLGQVLGPDDDCVVIADADMESARQLLEREKANGHAQVITVAELQEVNDHLDKDEIEDTDIWDEDDVVEPVASYDGHPAKSKTEPTLQYKNIHGHKVAIFNGFDVPGESLDSVEGLMNWLALRRGGALEVAAVHSGTGQSTAVINASIPEGSHIYALDCFTPHNFSTLPAENFNSTFAKEIASGRIQVDNLQRKMPHPETQQHLDCVFIEQFLTAEKLERWLPHVQPGGLIAGLGYDGKARPIVRKFAKEHELHLQDSGDVWALRVGMRAVAKEPEPIDDERVDLERLAELTDDVGNRF